MNGPGSAADVAPQNPPDRDADLGAAQHGGTAHSLASGRVTRVIECAVQASQSADPWRRPLCGSVCVLSGLVWGSVYWDDLQVPVRGPGLCCEPSPCVWVLSERGTGFQGSRQVLGETLFSQCQLLCLVARVLLGFWVC